jgi:hypothetical protein
MCLSHSGLLLCLVIKLEEGGSMFLRNPLNIDNYMTYISENRNRFLFRAVRDVCLTIESLLLLSAGLKLL